MVSDDKGDKDDMITGSDLSLFLFRSDFSLVKLCDFGSVRSAGDIVIKKVPAFHKNFHHIGIVINIISITSIIINSINSKGIHSISINRSYQ